jgi:Uma2 family endonuclease
MADNEWQERAILVLKTGFRHLLARRSDVHVAGDLLWYPVEGHPEICAAPDVFVIEGLDKDRLRSYRPWVHGGYITLAFEVLSHNNTALEMLDKLAFYERHGIEEYVVFDPATGSLRAWTREGDRLVPRLVPDTWTSPRYGVTIGTDGTELVAVGPDGRVWLTPEAETARAEAEAARADAAEAAATALRAEIERLRSG